MAKTAQDRPESTQPEKPKPWANGLAKMNQNRPLAKPNALQNVLVRLEAGESVPTIAQSLGITEFALYRALLRQAPDDWQGIQSAKALSKLDKSDAELDACSDGVQLGRARERIGLAKWNLERTARNIYGDKVQIEHTVSLETGEVLGEALDLVRSIRRRKEKVVNPED